MERQVTGFGGIMGISDMIDTIRRRPGMFLGSNSITALWHFLDGYQAAEREYALCRREELFPLPFRYFHEYTGYRLQGSSVMGWRLLILNACNGEEETALQKFFDFYDEFRQVKMKRYWKAVLSEENIAWNDQMKGVCRCSLPDNSVLGPPYAIGDLTVREPVYCNPLAVYVIELTIPVCILAVETAADIRLEIQFFVSPEKAKGDGLFPEGAEIYFGHIDSWEEFVAQNISFGKNIMVN